VLNGVMMSDPLITSSVTLIALAEKLPDPSRLTIAFAVLALVAALASTVAAATLAAVCPPTKLTTVAPCVPVTSPTNDPEKLVAELAVVALPLKFAVIVLAAKSPDASRDTMVFAVFTLVAVVAEFATFPALLIVASLVSTIAADGDTSAFIINELDNNPDASL
jgi:chromate transport protein ChrA